VRQSPIVVAGAGIGGLSAALSLAETGHPVWVLERAAAIEEVGAGLQIAPNAGRILQDLGLSKALAASALEPEAINIRRARDGVALARLPVRDVAERWGAPFRLFHRADLQQLLLDAAQRIDSISIRTSARVGDFEDEDGAVHLRVHGESGPEDIEALGLVGADGVRSGVRAGLVKSPGDAPVYAGHTAWRAILPADAASAFARRRETNLWLGPGAHLVHYPLRDASIVSAVFIVEAPQGAPDAPQTLAGDALLREARGFQACDELGALIAAGASWRRWPMFARPALKHWSAGSVTLLGDAAHPMLPFLAQGAAQAIEDADALAKAVSATQSLPQAFRDYEAARMARATRVQSQSRRQGSYFHADGLMARGRDATIGFLGGQGMLNRNAWLYR